MGKAKQDDEPKRPSLDGLLVHPILKSDNGLPPPSLVSKKGEEAEEQDNAYENWLIDHRGTARFYLGGFEALKGATGQRNAKHFVSFIAEAREIAQAEGWIADIADEWHTPASYNQFRKAIILGEPMFFEHALQVLVSCECALAASIVSGRARGHRFDVYRMMKIVPACYNIDAFNSTNLALLRDAIPNYDASVLTHAGQVSPHLLKLLASGNCVTRRTARAIRWKTLEFLRQRNRTDIEIGDVRGRPGKKRLGRKNATTVEEFELDDLAIF